MLAPSHTIRRTLPLIAFAIIFRVFASYISSRYPPASFNPFLRPANTTLKLYGYAGSTCTRRVVTVMKEKRVPYELIPVDLVAGAQKAPEYLDKIHPFGQVPVLDDDGFLVYESRAIARYIALKYEYQGEKLIPARTDLKATALFEQAVSIEQNNFDPYASGLAVEHVFKPLRGGKTDKKRAAELLENLEQKLEGYERILSKQKYLAGNETTLADLFHLSYGTLIQHQIGLDVMTSKPNVARWWNDITSRQSWQAVQDELGRVGPAPKQ